VKVLFTGIQPTGQLHIGNYFGAVRNWVRLQHEYRSYISIVDLHAVTIPYEPREMPDAVFQLALGLFACGIDIEKTLLFVQSEVPGHADLTWIFNTITPLGELERMTQFKDKAAQHRKTVNVGLLDYPVLQAADILIYKGEVVPVGEDQVQHVEFTREVARRFNSRFGDTFPECEAKLTASARIMGLDGDAKMSKSRATPSPCWRPGRRSGPSCPCPDRPRPGPAHRPRHAGKVQHLLLPPAGHPGAGAVRGHRPRLPDRGHRLHRLQAPVPRNLMAEFDPIRERHQALAARPDRVREALERNAETCRGDAKATLLEVKEKMGLSRTWKI